MRPDSFLTFLLLFAFHFSLDAHAQSDDCDSFDLLGEGKEIVDNYSGVETIRFGWVDNKYQSLDSVEQIQYEPGFRHAFGKQWDYAPLGVIRTGWESDGYGGYIGVWKSEQYGEARGRILCDQTHWDPATGPRVGQTFRLVGTVDKVFDVPPNPDTSPYDFAWTLYQTATDVQKSSDPLHGAYVSHITWELKGTVYARPKSGSVRTISPTETPFAAKTPLPTQTAPPEEVVPLTGSLVPPEAVPGTGANMSTKVTSSTDAVSSTSTASLVEPTFSVGRRQPRWGPLVRVDRLWDYMKPLWAYWYLVVAGLIISGYILRDLLRILYYRWRPLPGGRLLIVEDATNGKVGNINIWYLARKLRKRRLSIGSSEEADICLPHASVEKQHAQIFARRFEGGVAAYVERLGTAAVVVNDARGKIMTLGENADVRIGDFRFQFEAPDEYRHVQIRYKNGKTLEGVPATWDIDDDGFTLLPSRALSWADVKFVRFDKLKGIYFSKDWDEDIRKGIKGEKSLRDRPATICFRDGEVRDGYLMGNYRDEAPRFYFFPKDQSGDTVYILIERSSIRSVGQTPVSGLQSETENPRPA